MTHLSTIIMRVCVLLAPALELVCCDASPALYKIILKTSAAGEFDELTVDTHLFYLQP